MPQGVSSPSSEDEAEAPVVESGTQNGNNTKKKKVRYECPSDFVTFCHEPCRSTWTDNLKNNNNKELWLIKAPADFNPESFTGVNVALAGLHTLRIPGAESEQQQQQRYNVLASERPPSELRLLTADRLPSDGLVLGPAFSGLLSVCESYTDDHAHRVPPHAIPKAPTPAVPPGLKLRFHLGDGQVATPWAAAGDEPDNRTSEKKRKREKRPKEAVEVKQEMEEEVMDNEDESRRRKKKKKKKNREDGLELDVMVKDEQLEVKSEPADTSYGNVTQSDAMRTNMKKKKKKKKSNKHEED